MRENNFSWLWMGRSRCQRRMVCRGETHRNGNGLRSQQPIQEIGSRAMPKIDITAIKVDVATGYPDSFRAAVAGRQRRRLGNAAALDQFGVNLTRLLPGAQSS